MKKRHILLASISVLAFSVTRAADNADSSSFYLQKAKEQKQARRIWEAEKSFQKAVAFDPQNDAVRLEFGAYYCDQRKYSLASQQYNVLLKKNPNHALALAKMVDLSFLLRKWTEVIELGERANKAGLKIERINYMLGQANFEEENYGQAKVNLLEQIKLTPAHKETITLLGKVYVQLNNYNEAIAMYTKLLETSPDNIDVMYELGLLYAAQKKDKDAVKYFEMAAAKGYKQDLAFLENLGMSYLEFDLEKGVEVMNKVLVKKPGDAEILTQIAQAYYTKGDYGKAFDYYYKIYLADNKNAKALYMSGVSMIRKGDKTKGSYICDQAIAIDPSLASLKSTKSNL